MVLLLGEQGLGHFHLSDSGPMMKYISHQAPPGELIDSLLLACFMRLDCLLKYRLEVEVRELAVLHAVINAQVRIAIVEVGLSDTVDRDNIRLLVVQALRGTQPW